uniref:Uncharacterized protein n=1 Tax=Steinernema glaseri TaxID=37863 RepID=A0A1I7ZM08_9BILA
MEHNIFTEVDALASIRGSQNALKKDSERELPSFTVQNNFSPNQQTMYQRTTMKERAAILRGLSEEVDLDQLASKIEGMDLAGQFDAWVEWMKDNKDKNTAPKKSASKTSSKRKAPCEEVRHPAKKVKDQKEPMTTDEPMITEEPPTEEATEDVMDVDESKNESCELKRK